MRCVQCKHCLLSPEDRAYYRLTNEKFPMECVRPGFYLDVSYERVLEESLYNDVDEICDKFELCP